MRCLSTYCSAAPSHVLVTGFWFSFAFIGSI